ncbi:MAG: tryptophan-rich sensory protein [Rhodospirillales bacterium]|nr:tryptophan-rich sensory protein [Rhodospirillales bacterium]
MTEAAPPLWTPILVAAIVTFAVAALGSALTDIGPWYYALKKPSWQPPDWLFPVGWTIIFTLTATAAVLSWRAAYGTPLSAWIVVLFAFNGVLNALWSALFFRLQRPDWALIEVVLLWLSIVALIAVTALVSRTAAVLLLPYLLWVTFASALNTAVVRMNAPFGAT